MNLLHPPTPRRRAAGWLAALAAALAVLGGCGPTTGGSGTGDAVVTLSSFGATPASACTSAFAAALVCDGNAGVADGTGPGTRDVFFGVGDGERGVALHLFDNHAVLSTACGSLRFEGQWGRLADGSSAYFGAWLVAGAAPVPARLSVRAFLGGSLELTVVSGDAIQGLLGPLRVERLLAPASTTGC